MIYARLFVVILLSSYLSIVLFKNVKEALKTGVVRLGGRYPSKVILIERKKEKFKYWITLCGQTLLLPAVAIAMLVIWLGCYFAAKLLAQEKLSEFVKELENSKATSTLFLSGSAIFVFSYLGISMGDYKLWTGLLIAAGLARLANPVNKEIKFLLLTPLLVGMWGSRFAPNWMEYVGDFSLLLLSCGLFVITFEYMRVNLQRLRLNSN
jgi:hypothetical protein